MKALTLSDASMMLLALQDEIRRSEDARYDHRLHAVLLVAQGESCRKVARLLGDAPRSVENWVHRFEARGFAGLLEGERSGRPSRLSAPQLERIGQVLRGSPRFVGIEIKQRPECAANCIFGNQALVHKALDDNEGIRCIDHGQTFFWALSA